MQLAKGLVWFDFFPMWSILIGWGCINKPGRSDEQTLEFNIALDAPGSKSSTNIMAVAASWGHLSS